MIKREITFEEQKLIDHAKEGIVKYNKIRHAHSGIDTLYSFVLTDSGNMYNGA